MDLKTLGTHALDIAKGALAAALMGALLSFMQYLGAHIPDLIQVLTQAGSATAAIKITRVIS